MVSTFLNIYYSLIGICLLLSLTVYFRRPVPFYLKLIPPFLAITIIENIVSEIMGQRTGNNHSINNFYSVLFFSFYMYLLTHIIQHPRVRKMILHICWIFPCIACTNIFFGQGLHHFHTITYSLGAIISISFLGWHFMDLTGRDQPHIRITTDPGFWICAGLFAFYPLTFIYFAAILIIVDYPPLFLKFMFVSFMLGNCLLYIAFSIGFYFFIKTTNPKH